MLLVRLFIGTSAKPKYLTVSEILAINDRKLLVDKRNGKGWATALKLPSRRFTPILQNEATDVNQESLAASKFLNCELRIANCELVLPIDLTNA
ncbi:hypothetical protein LC607_07935 [Nostoc sp. CHAB 5824]|nr:hypothetical protein [Nostoc sp. CHAB 5824]